MSLIGITDSLESTNDYSQIKLTEFLTNIGNKPYFYSSVIDHKSLINYLIDDPDVDFCILEFQAQFELVASELFQIDLNEVKNELRKNNKTANTILTALEITPKLAENATRTLIWYKIYFNAILQNILEQDRASFEMVHHSGWANLKVNVHKPALLKIHPENEDFIDDYESLILEELRISSESYKQIFEFPFTLLFDVEIQSDDLSKTIRMPFLLGFGKELREMEYSVVKYRFCD